ncbi:MAG: hypothetical protein PHP79_10100, partial [Clostridia bacterium]|nr:hypothetical protein [Clostridia bacterium]
MYYHPADTTLIYNTINKEQIENLWYETHYFQQISLAKEDKDRLKPLQERITLNRPAQAFLDGLLEEREHYLTQLSSTHELAVLKGTIKARLVHGMGAA